MPCRYIEIKRSFLCGMVVKCEFPKGNERAYVDYVVALFDKSGYFQKLSMSCTGSMMTWTKNGY